MIARETTKSEEPFDSIDSAAFTEDEARHVLARFSREISWCAQVVHGRFPSIMPYEDVLQEARLLVLTYAGLTKTGRHHGRLIDMEWQAQGDDYETHRILATDLKLDLLQIIGRISESEPLPTTALEPLIGTRYEPSDEHDLMEERIIKRVDFRRELPRLRKLFPYLMAHTVDGLTEAEIAEACRVHQPSVSRRIQREAKRAEAEPFFWPLNKDGIPVDPRKG